MKWEFDEELFLLELFENTRNCSAREKDIKIQELSNLLNERASLLGIQTDETFRNFIGIRMKLLNIEYIASNGEYGLENYSALDLKVYKLFSENHDKFNQSLNNAKEKIKDLRKVNDTVNYRKDDHPEDNVDKNNDYFDEEDTAFYIIFNIPLEETIDFELSSETFSVRTFNCLKKAKINSYFQLLQSNQQQLSNIKSMGKKSINEVIGFIQKFNGSTSVPSISKAKNVPKIILQNKDRILNCDFSFQEKTQSTEDLVLIQNYQAGFELIDHDLILSCIYHPDSVIPIMECLKVFATDAVIKEQRKRKIAELIQDIPDCRKNSDFLSLFSLFSNDSILLPSIVEGLPYKECKVKDLPYQKNIDNKTLYFTLTSFIEWCNYDIANRIESFFSKHILNNKRTHTILSNRAEGKTLEYIGKKFDLTRERIRQIEAKARFEFEQWQDRENSLPKISIDLNVDYLSVSDIETYFKDNTLIALYLLRNSYNTKYTYNSSLDVFVVGNHDTLNEVQEVVDSLPDLFSIEEYRKIIEQNHNIDTGLLKIAINEAYQLSGKIYHRNRLTRTEMCRTILKKYYPEGIHIYDQKEIRDFSKKIELEFGQQAFSDSSRSIIARVSEVGILCGRGTYKAKQERYISKRLLNKIVAFVNNSSQIILMINAIFDAFYKELLIEGVDNKYYLQGILHEELGNKYIFRRDYISKDDTITSYSTEIIKFIKQYKYPVPKETIIKNFPGITEIVINLAIQDRNIINYFGSYIYANNLNLVQEDKTIISQLLNNSFNDSGYIHIKDFYLIVQKEYPSFNSRLFIEYPYCLFNILLYLLPGRYTFKRPFIARIGADINKPVDIISDYVMSNDIVDIDDILDLSKELHYTVYSILDFINQFNSDYLLINTHQIAKISYIGVSEKTCKEIEELIEKEVEDNIRIRDLSSIFKLKTINVPWTDWLIYSIIYKWSNLFEVGTTSNQFKLSVPIIAKKGKIKKTNMLQQNSKPSDFKIQVDDLDDLENLEIEFSSEDF